jgi:hypothetical protein
MFLGRQIHRRRPLRLEPLEGRRLLACDMRTVNSTIDPERAGDIDFDDDVVSLREAIMAAADDKSCDIIFLPKGVYQLTSELANRQGGDLDIHWRGGDYSPVVEIRSVADDEDPRETVIEGAWTGTEDRLIDVPMGAMLTVRNLTLRNGNANGSGGAIRSFGELTVVNSYLHHNTAKGGGAISIEEDCSDEPGGECLVDESDYNVYATITDTYLANNTSTTQGGAISHGHGRLLLDGSTLAHNDAAQRGGGLAVLSGTVKMTNSTMSTNVAGRGGGGMYVDQTNKALADACKENICTSNVISSTIYQNTARGETAGGGVDAQAPALVKVENSIVAGNAAWHEENANQLLEKGMNLEGSVDSKGNNLFGDVLGAVHPQVRMSDLAFRDPQLEPLAIYRGVPPTHAPRNASAAIGKGEPTSATPAFDRNGVERGDVFDLGAVEYVWRGAPPEQLLGDTNGDCVIDIFDLNNVRNNFGSSAPGILGDTDNDGVVGIADLNNVRNNFGAICTDDPVAGVIDVTQLTQCGPAPPYCAIPKANDSIRDTDGIQYALNEARRIGQSTVYVPSGEFLIEGLVLRGYALAFVGPGTLKLAPNSKTLAALIAFGQERPIGNLPVIDVPEDLPTRPGFVPTNWIDGLTIDGNNKTGVIHDGESIGLAVEGHSLLMSRLTVKNAALGAESPEASVATSGINVRVRGNNNHLYAVDSLFAGDTAFRNVGDENHYVDILARNFGCRGFRALLGDGQNVVGGGIYIEGVDDGEAADFETNQNGEKCAGGAIASILIDPIPVGNQSSQNRITKLVLRNLDIAGPERVEEGNVVKIAAVDDVLIEDSRFTHDSGRLHSLRFDQGSTETLPTGGKQYNSSILIKNSTLARSIVFEDTFPDGKQKPIVKSLVLDHVTIGDNVPANDLPDYSIQGLRVWDHFSADYVTFNNFSRAGIQWPLPTTPPGRDTSAAMTVTNSQFNGRDAQTIYALALKLNDPDAKVACSRFTWDDNVVTNPLGFELFFEEDFPCRPAAAFVTSSGETTQGALAIRAVTDWVASDVLMGWSAAADNEPILPLARRDASRRR